MVWTHRITGSKSWQFSIQKCTVTNTEVQKIKHRYLTNDYLFNICVLFLHFYILHCVGIKRGCQEKLIDYTVNIKMINIHTTVTMVYSGKNREWKVSIFFISPTVFFPGASLMDYTDNSIKTLRAQLFQGFVCSTYSISQRAYNFSAMDIVSDIEIIRISQYRPLFVSNKTRKTWLLHPYLKCLCIVLSFSMQDLYTVDISSIDSILKWQLNCKFRMFPSKNLSLNTF